VTPVRGVDERSTEPGGESGRLMVDGECNPEPHPGNEKEICKGRRGKLLGVQPKTHTHQSIAEISVADLYFGSSHDARFSNSKACSTSCGFVAGLEVKFGEFLQTHCARSWKNLRHR
jgi:hypothetical protein